MSHKNRPYDFYDTTTALCESCLHTIEAKILFQNDQVVMEKFCPVHGKSRALIADDVDYYRQCREVFIKRPEMPERFATPMRYGCPYDCGLCTDHMQHSCLSIVEITDRCNLECPVCFAGSGPSEQLAHRSFSEVCQMLDAVVASEGEADVVQISGGEPTLHPDFFAILDAARARPIKHLMVNTNGLRIANEDGFAERLADYLPGFELYLQFDGLDNAQIKPLRGANLAGIHQKALAKLDALNLSTTLVVTVQKGLNDHVLGEIIEYAMNHRCVRGVTFQPLHNAGRVAIKHGVEQRLTVSALRRKIAEQSALFTLHDIVPVPCNPDTLAMGYAIRLDEEILPLTRYIDPQTLIDGSRNTIVFEHDADFRQRAMAELFKVMSTNHSPTSQANCLSDLLCCLPQIDAPELSYENVFRIMIVQFMDAHNMDIRALKKSCIHFAQPDGQMIPFESYNLFYRGKTEQATLESIRARLRQR